MTTSGGAAAKGGVVCRAVAILCKVPQLHDLHVKKRALASHADHALVERTREEVGKDRHDRDAHPRPPLYGPSTPKLWYAKSFAGGALWGPGGPASPPRRRPAAIAPMDVYTEETRAWLDRRFRQVDASGVYLAHQPIYGFRAGHAEDWPTVRYIITLSILRALAHLRFDSLLDVGGAEGYKAALAREVFGGEAWSCDLSAEACRRAAALYHLPGEAVDIHALPFEDDRFDVVMCSETLEHVTRIEDATRELLRVAKRAVVITVPREPVAVVERNIREKVPHGHIHALRPHSFDFARPVARRILVRKMLCTPLAPVYPLADAMPKPADGRAGRYVAGAYNGLLPVIRALVQKSAVAGLIEADLALANTGLPYQGLLFVLLKDEAEWSERARLAVPARRMLDFAVPLHRPENPYVPEDGAPAPAQAPPGPG